MTNFQLGVLMVAFVLVALCVINRNLLKQLVIKIRGRSEQIARDDAATASGASDYFNNAVREKEDLYSKAEKSFVEISGKLDESEKQRYQMKKEVMKYDQEINAALDKNDEDTARQYAMKKATANQKIEVLNGTIEELEKAKAQQDEIRKGIKSELDSLKEEKERTLFQMEADQQIIALHEGMNTEASSSESDRMLERVREGAKKTRERAAGSQIAYETSAAAQDRRLEAQRREHEANDILNEAKRRRNAQ